MKCVSEAMNNADYFESILFFRVPEIIHQPCILGLEQAGLAETIEYVLKKFSPDVQDQLVQVDEFVLSPIHICHLSI